MAKSNQTSLLNFIIEATYSLQEYVQSEFKYDEEIDSWSLIHSPWPMCSIVIVYLLFVLKIGPKMMESKEAYNITDIILMFNFLQFSYNSLLCLWIIFTPGLPQYIATHLCYVTKENQHEIYMTKCLHTISYFYFISKIIDLLDTVFFVLRKKQSQVSFLHVYHHTKMVVSYWVYIRFFKSTIGISVAIIHAELSNCKGVFDTFDKSEQAAYGAMLNSSVHIAMYGYYFLAALGPYMQKYLWWKVYVTRLQIAQLFIAAAYVIYLYKNDCTMPKSMAFLIIIDLLTFIYLFVNFYIDAYVSKVKKSYKNKSK